MPFLKCSVLLLFGYFLLSLHYSVTTPTTQWKRAARVFFTLFYTSLFFETAERTEE